MRPVLILALLLGGLSPALAQSPGGAPLSGSPQQTSPSQQCERNRQVCMRRCFTESTPSCLDDCTTAYAQCIRNPHARPPRR